MKVKIAKRTASKSVPWQGASNGTANPKSTAGAVKAKPVPATTPRGLPIKDTAGMRGASPKPVPGKLGR